MSNKLKRANPGHDPLYARLDDIRMPAHERLIARAHLARAEAISDLIVAGIRALKSLPTALAARRARRSLARIG